MKEIGTKRQQAAAHHQAGHTEDALSFLREGREGGGREGGRGSRILFLMYLVMSEM